MHRLVLTVTHRVFKLSCCVFNPVTEQLDTANKQRAAREAECTDRRQSVFVRLLEQSKSFIGEVVLRHYRRAEFI